MLFSPDRAHGSTNIPGRFSPYRLVHGRPNPSSSSTSSPLFYASNVLSPGNLENEDDSSTSEVGGNTPRRPRSIAEFVCSTTTRQKEEFDQTVAEFFYTNSIAFNIAKSQSYNKLFSKLRPSYTPPSIHQLLNGLLKKKFRYDKDEILKLLDQGMYLALVTDGFSNIRRDHVVNYVLVVYDRSGSFSKTFYWKSEVIRDSDGLSAASIFAEIDKVLIELGPEKFTSVVTDNCNAMAATWAMIEEKYPWIFANGCAAHGLNLLAKDIIEIRSNKDAVQEAHDVTKFILLKTKILSQFKSIQLSTTRADTGTKPRNLQQPVATRWYSCGNMLSRLIENMSVVRALWQVAERDERLVNRSNQEEFRRLKTFIESNQRWDRLSALHSLLKPIMKSIGALESDKSSLSQVYKEFKILFSNTTLHTHVMARWNFMHTSSMGMAYMLDPSMGGGNDMVGSDFADTVEQLETYVTTNRGILFSDMGFDEELSDDDLLDSVRAELRSFTTMAAEPTSEEKTIMRLYPNPLSWWINRGKRYALLRQIALRIFSVPTSSASSERIWSIFDHIHSKRRNRLADWRVDALVFIYANNAFRENLNDDDLKDVDWLDIPLD